MSLNKKRPEILSVAVIIVFTFFALASINGSRNNADSASAPDTEKKKPETVKLGGLLHTEYFDVTAHSMTITKEIKTGDEFADLKPEEGVKYLVINATFKNTDKERRMIMDGSLWITYNGKEYEYDNAETFMVEGWGTTLENLNPLMSKTTNIVYKLPEEISGPVQWQPGRANRSDVIELIDIPQWQTQKNEK